MKQLVLVNQNKLAIIADQGTSTSTLTILERQPQSEIFQEKESSPGLPRILRLFSHEEEIFCGTANGLILNSKTIKDNPNLILHDGGSHHHFPIIAATKVQDHVNQLPSDVNLQHLVFGLTNLGRLYSINPHTSHVQMNTTCTSFLLTPTHLLLTTHNLLKTIPLPTDPTQSIEIPSDDIDDERIRQIERGSKLVTVMPSTHSIVLQAPRGNLETVSPRALVLASVRQNIEQREFRKAYMTCRTHRIDMNILWSHKEDIFMQNVELFVQQILDVEHIDLFLSSLKEPVRFVGKSSVVDGKPSRHIIVADDMPGEGKKVSAVCDAVLAELLANYSKTHTQSILTAHLSKIPPDIPSALRVIADLKGLLLLKGC